MNLFDELPIYRKSYSRRGKNSYNFSIYRADGPDELIGVTGFYWPNAEEYEMYGIDNSWGGISDNVLDDLEDDMYYDACESEYECAVDAVLNAERLSESAITPPSDLE